MKIKIEKHNIYWKFDYQKEQNKIQQQCKKNKLTATVQHIGSTAVKDLVAKPTIDIMVGIPEESNLDEYIAVFRKLGYIYVSKYNDIMPYRRFFIKIKSMALLDENRKKEITKEDEMPSKRVFERLKHVHLVHKETLFYQKHIAFRDHLQKNEIDRKMYQELKLHLSQFDWDKEGDYAQAKTSFISSILSKIGFDS